MLTSASSLSFGRRPLIRHFSSSHISTWRDFSEKKSIPSAKTGACSFVSPFLSGKSNNPPNVILGVQK